MTFDPLKKHVLHFFLFCYVNKSMYLCLHVSVSLFVSLSLPFFRSLTVSLGVFPILTPWEALLVWLALDWQRSWTVIPQRPAGPGRWSPWWRYTSSSFHCTQWQQHLLENSIFHHQLHISGFWFMGLPEGSTVKGGRQWHDGVDNRQEAEEEDEQQQTHVEVVGLGCLEHSLMGDVGGHDGPALVVHGA